MPISSKRIDINSYDLFMQAPMGVCVLVGPEFFVALANDPYLELIDRSKDEIVSRNLFEAAPELSGQGFEQLLLDVMTSGVAFKSYNHKVVVKKNGEPVTLYLDFTYQPFREPGGEAKSVMVVVNEVTHHNKLRQSIEESEKKYRNLVEQATVATAIYIGIDMEIHLANDAMLRLWGKDSSVIGKRLRDALPELEGQPFHDLLTHVFRTGETYHSETDHADLVVDGRLQRFYFNFTYKALRNLNGEIYGILNMAVDVSSQVQLKALLEAKVRERTSDLQATNDKLTRANSELEQFAYIASHDLQEPVRKIQIFGDRLHRKNAQILDEESISWLERLLVSASRLGNLIRDLLNYSGVNKNHQHSFAPVDLGKMAKQVLYDLELIIHQKNARVELDELPVIDGLELQLNQLFYNLLSNSLKFSNTNTPLIRIKSYPTTDVQLKDHQLNSSRSYITLEFIDNGIGFRPEMKEHIFEIFQRLHTRDTYPGTGIGLALCKKVVSNHDGIIFADAHENEGACFTVILPVTQSLQINTSRNKSVVH